MIYTILIISQDNDRHTKKCRQEDSQEAGRY
jgi:hypothetical protein